MKNKKVLISVVTVLLITLVLCGIMFFSNKKQLDDANDYAPINYRDTTNSAISPIESHTLEIGKTLLLDYSRISKNSIYKKVSFSSSNNSIATVNSSGVVTAKGVGNAIITVSGASTNTSSNSTISYNVMIKVIENSIVVNCPTITYDSKTDPKKMYVELEQSDDISYVDWYANTKNGKKDKPKYSIGEDAFWLLHGTIEGNEKVRVGVDYAGGYARQVRFYIKYKSGQSKVCYSSPIPYGISVNVPTNDNIVCPSYNQVGKTTDGNNVKLAYNLGSENYQYTWIPKSVVYEPLGFAKLLTSTVSSGKLLSNSTMVNIENKDNFGNLIVMDENGSIKSCFTETFEGKSATSIGIVNAPVEMMVGENRHLSVSYNPSNAKPVSVKWSSDNNTVLRVDDKGNVTALKTGTAKITATSTKDASISKTVTIKVVKSNLTCPKITYDYSDSKKVKIKVEPTANTTSWEWYTNQPDSNNSYMPGSYAIWKSFGSNTGKKTVTLSYVKDDAAGNSKTRQGKIVVKNKQGVTKDCYTHYFMGSSKGFYTVSSNATCPTYSVKRDSSKVAIKYNLTDNGYQYSWFDGSGDGYMWTKDMTNASSASYVINTTGFARSGKLAVMDASGNIKVCPTDTYDIQIAENTSKTTTINQAYGDGKTKMIIEKGVSNDDADKFIKAVKNINTSRKNSKTGKSYKMGNATEVYLLKPSTFDKIWGKGYCGMAMNLGKRRIVTVPANNCNNEGTISHELAHTSDFYYQMNKGIRVTPSLLSGIYKNNNTLNLNEAEFWANLYMRYYGYYKNSNKSEFTSAELKTYRDKIEKVIEELNNL